MQTEYEAALLDRPTEDATPLNSIYVLPLYIFFISYSNCNCEGRKDG